MARNGFSPFSLSFSSEEKDLWTVPAVNPHKSSSWLNSPSRALLNKEGVGLRVAGEGFEFCVVQMRWIRCRLLLAVPWPGGFLFLSPPRFCVISHCWPTSAALLSVGLARKSLLVCPRYGRKPEWAFWPTRQTFSFSFLSWSCTPARVPCHLPLVSCSGFLPVPSSGTAASALRAAHVVCLSLLVDCERSSGQRLALPVRAHLHPWCLAGAQCLAGGGELSCPSAVTGFSGHWGSSLAVSQPVAS